MPGITITVTSGNQVEGLELDHEIVDLLLGAFADPEKALRLVKALKDILSLHVQFDQGLGLRQAAEWVDQHTTEVH